MNAAISYGEALISTVPGQQQIIKDAKAGKKEAQDYLFIKFQKKIIGFFAMAKEETEDVLPITIDEWLSLAYEALTLEEGKQSADFWGKSALAGYDFEAAKIKSPTAAPEATLNVLADRYGRILQNVAKILGDNINNRPDIRKKPGEDDEQFKARKDSISLKPDSLDRMITDDSSRKDKTGPTNKTVADMTDLATTKTDPANNNFDAKGEQDFLNKFKAAVSSPRLSKEMSDGSKLCQALLYRLGEPLGDEKDGNEKNASVKEIVALFPAEEKNSVTVLLNNIPEFLEKNNISKEDMFEYASKAEVMDKMRNIIKQV
jgi:hypothetical protein